MAYTPPLYNDVDVDLYIVGGLLIPAFNNVNVDLNIDDTATLNTISLLPIDVEIVGIPTVIRKLDFVRPIPIDGEVGTPLVINRPAIYPLSLDGELGIPFIERTRRFYSWDSLDDESLGLPVVTHLNRTIGWVSLDDELFVPPLVYNLKQEMVFPAIEDEYTPPPVITFRIRYYSYPTCELGDVGIPIIKSLYGPEESLNFMLMLF